MHLQHIKISFVFYYIQRLVTIGEMMMCSAVTQYFKHYKQFVLQHDLTCTDKSDTSSMKSMGRWECVKLVGD